MCTIAVAKVQPNYNCYNVYFYECLRLSRMEPSSFKDETFTLPRGKIKVSSFVGGNYFHITSPAYSIFFPSTVQSIIWISLMKE